MGFDTILGVGKEPGRQPAFLIEESDFSEAQPNTATHNHIISEAVVANVVDVLVTYTGTSTSVPTIVLNRNGVEIDRLLWGLTFTDIAGASGTGQSILYKYRLETTDFFSNGDILQCVMSSAGGSGTINTKFRTIVSGFFV